ncbi:hypothetical protein ACH4NS_23720 [Streptomyces mutabilis]|uniref:hypothetical protein n=1 Tax=Streptomyces mutabilis TaxID=67332 RepID=UPI0037923983
MSEALSTLAAAGGTALVGAAATDVWHTARTGFAHVLGRGEAGLEEIERGRLDRIAQDVEQTPEARRDDVRRRLEQRWTGRLETLLEEHPEAAEELRALVDDISSRLPQVTHTWVQNNVAEAGGVQHITQRGDINVGGAIR